METREVVNQVSVDTALEIARYQDALDKQRRELTRLVARMKAARAAIHNSPFWTQTKGTGVGALLVSVDSLLVSDAVIEDVA
jgi:hypothetical protein